MTINVYTKGNKRNLTAEFRDVASGDLIDPTTVALEVTRPSGTVDVYTWALGQVTRTSLGKFAREVDLTERGRWAYRWISTGVGQAAERGEFEVEA